MVRVSCSSEYLPWLGKTVLWILENAFVKLMIWSLVPQYRTISINVPPKSLFPPNEKLFLEKSHPSTFGEGGHDVLFYQWTSCGMKYLHILDSWLRTEFLLLYQICDLPNTEITKFVINGEQMDKMPWNLSVWRNLIKIFNTEQKKSSKLEYLGMKKSTSDFEHIPFLSFILRFWRLFCVHMGF